MTPCSTASRASCPWRRSISPTTWRRSGPSEPAVRTCRRWPASIPPSITAIPRSPCVTPFRTSYTARACAGTDSTAYPTSTSRRRCRASRRRSPAAVVVVAHLGSGAVDVRHPCRPQHRQHDGVHGAGRAADGHAHGTDRPRRAALSPGHEGLGCRAARAVPLSGMRVEGPLRRQQRHARPACLEAPLARIAVDYFVYRIQREAAALAAAMGGIDGLVFTGGIGENAAVIRSRVCEGLAWLGLAFDATANARHGPVFRPPICALSAWVIPTDEERMIARHTHAVSRRRA